MLTAFLPRSPQLSWTPTTAQAPLCRRPTAPLRSSAQSQASFKATLWLLCSSWWPWTTYVLRRCLDEDDSYVLATRRSSRYLAVFFFPALADDIALFCYDPSAAQRALTRLCEESERVGLRVNAEKTEVLNIGFPDAPALALPTGEAISRCDDFRYLGSRLASPDSIVADRRAQAWRASHLLRPIFFIRLLETS